MRESQSFQYTIQYLRILEKEVYQCVDELGGNDALKAIIALLMAEIQSIPQ